MRLTRLTGHSLNYCIQIMSTGRGGAGNIISRSKDRSTSRGETESVLDTIVSTGEAEYEKHLIREHAAARAAGKVSCLTVYAAHPAVG